MIEVAVISLFTLVGSITQRVIGFGIAPFVSPVLLIFFDPPIAVVTTIFLGTLACVMVLFEARNHRVIIPGVIGRILMAAIPGLIIGSFIVTRIDKALLQVILGVVVILAVVVQERAFPKPTRPLGVTRGISPVGFLTGLFNATAANGSPPLVMWMRTHTSSPNQIRQNIAAIFICVNICSLTAIHILRPQTLNGQAVYIFAMLVPIVLAGNAIGAWLLNRLNVRLYEKLVVIAIIFTGLVSAGLGFANSFRAFF